MHALVCCSETEDMVSITTRYTCRQTALASSFLVQLQCQMEHCHERERQYDTGRGSSLLETRKDHSFVSAVYDCERRRWVYTKATEIFQSICLCCARMCMCVLLTHCGPPYRLCTAGDCCRIGIPLSSRTTVLYCK